MIKPPMPPCEASRLLSLQALNILDTESEERFDRVTRLAKRLFDVPIALVSLVDSNRQWFKSKQGLGAPETSREISFCGHTILENKILVIENALNDDRFYDNPLVVNEPSIRFYAGRPLEASDGHRLGTLCIIDRIPRNLSSDDLILLDDLSKLIEDEIKVMSLSLTDELTGISNRRGFVKISSYIFEMCRRLDRSMTLLNIDLDKFKSINDNYGHQEGDKVLKAMSTILLDTFRNSDIVARIGGDEFYVLCSGVASTEEHMLIERLSENVHQYNESHPAPYKIEFSAGSTTYDPTSHHSMDAMIKHSDQLMYQHKNKKTQD